MDYFFTIYKVGLFVWGNSAKIPFFTFLTADSIDSMLDKINDDDPRIIIPREETIWTELLDQTAHMVVAFLILSLFVFGVKKKPLLIGLICGFFIGFIREVTEEGSLITPEIVMAVFRDIDAYIDLFFWSLGGFFAGLLYKKKAKF